MIRQASPLAARTPPADAEGMFPVTARVRRASPSATPSSPATGFGAALLRAAEPTDCLEHVSAHRAPDLDGDVLVLWFATPDADCAERTARSLLARVDGLEIDGGRLSGHSAEPLDLAAAWR